MTIGLVATLALAPLVPLVNTLRTSNTIAGGSGGAVMASASYRLEGSLNGAVLVASNSAAYRLCSGFICVTDYVLNLPLTIR